MSGSTPVVSGVTASMPPLEGRFEQMAISAGVPSVFIEFLRKAGITQADSFAVWCAEEKLIQTEILDAAKADGHEVTDIKHKIAVKKLWHLARKYERTRRVGWRSSKR